MIQFDVPGIPAPQGSHRAFMRPGARYPVVVHDNARTKPWRALVALAAMPHRPSPLLSGAVSLTVRFYLPRPKSLPKRVLHHTKRPDVDKLVRSLCDSLKGVIWEDDAQVVKIVATKNYGDPGCAIVIESIQ